MRALILALLMGVAASAAGADVYRCEKDGEIIFSGSACELGQTREDAVQVTAPHSGWNGQRIIEQNWMLLEDYENRKKRRAQAIAGSKSRSSTPSYSDRLRARELEMEKRKAQDSLRWIGSQGLGNYGKARAAAEQIQGLDRQLEEIYRKR